MEQTMGAYNVDGTLVVPEKRSTINKLKDWYIKHGMAEKSDKLIIFVHDAKKGYDEVVAAVAPAILQIFGDDEAKMIAKFVPALCKISSAAADIATKGILKAKGAVEGFIGIEKSEATPEINVDLEGLSGAIKTGIGGVVGMDNPNTVIINENDGKDVDLAEKKPENPMEGLKDILGDLGNIGNKTNNNSIDLTVKKSEDPSKKFYEVLSNLDNANVLDIHSVLCTYNGEPIMVDGGSYTPFNDPVIANKLNEKFRSLTGKDHPSFVKESPAIVEGLLRDKDMLLQAGAYSPEYFDMLEQIKDDLGLDVKDLSETGGMKR